MPFRPKTGIRSVRPNAAGHVAAGSVCNTVGLSRLTIGGWTGAAMDADFEFKLRRARTQTIEQRLVECLELSDLLADMAVAGLRVRRPELSDEEIRRIVIEQRIESQARSYRK